MNALMKPIESMSVTERAANALNQAETEEQIKALVEESKPIVAVTDSASREVCHGSLMTLKNMRILIQNRAKDGRDEAVKYSKAVIAIEKELVALITPEETRLAAIRDEWDTAKEREKEAKIAAEIARVAAIQERIAELRGCQTLSPSSGSTLIMEHIHDLDAIPVDSTFEEFEQQAHDAKIAALVRLKGILGAAVAHEAEQKKIIEERAELAKLREAEEQRQAMARAEQAEKDRLAKIESDRSAKEADDKRKTEAREQRERLAKEEADAKAQRDAAAKADEENSRRNEMAMQEVQAIHHQLMIADTGRRPYCNGGDLASIDFAIDGTEKWELTEERLGALFAMAVKTKETTLAALRQKRVDFIARQANADEAKRQAELAAKITADREQLARDQEAARKAAEPKPEPAKVRTVERPSAAQIVACVAGHYSVSAAMATKWLVATKIELEAA
jgi:hypothetical protein